MLLYQMILPMLRTPSVTILFQSIINQYLSNSYCVTVVSEGHIDFRFNLTFVYIAPTNSDEELTNQLLLVSEKGCSDYLVNMREPQRFLVAFDIVSKLGIVRRSDRKIIFLPYPGYYNKRQSLAVLSMKQTNFIANLLMIIPNKKFKSTCEIYDIFTHKFGGTWNVDEFIYLDQWDSCTEKFKINNNLFPHDINNLYGKVVKVAAFTYKPYAILDLDHSIAPSGWDGTEIRIVEEFCRWLNCTMEIVREDKDQWGEVLKNGTGIGIIGSVAEDRADMGIAALYSWYEEFQYLDFSSPTVRASVTCVAPSPRLLSSWRMPLMSFSRYLWYAVIFTIIFASIGLVLAKRCSFDGVLLTVFGVIISQSQINVNSWRIRSVTGWLVIAALILGCAYGGGLASVFTVPNYEPSIDTIQDIVDRDMEWGATHDAWIFSLILSNEPLVKKLVSQFRIQPKEELLRRSFTRDMAFCIEKLPAGYFAVGDYITKEAMRDLTLMLEDFYYAQSVVMLRKSSPYTEKMNALMGRLHQSGILLAWETQVALKHLNFEVQQEMKLSRLHKDVGFANPLSLSDVVGIFVIYMTGILLSLLLFLGEIFMNKLKLFFGVENM